MFMEDNGQKINLTNSVGLICDREVDDKSKENIKGEAVDNLDRIKTERSLKQSNSKTETFKNIAKNDKNKSTKEGFVKSFSKYFQSLKEKFKVDKKLQIAFVVLLSAIVLLIFLGSLNSNTNDVENVKDDNIYKDDALISVDEYESFMEERLVKILGGIKNVSDVKAMVVVEQSIEYVYATDKEQERECDENGEDRKENNYINEYLTTIKGGDGNSVVVVKKIYPKVSGVLIVAKGADDPKIRLQILNAVAVCLDIETSCIEVLSS